MRTSKFCQTKTAIYGKIKKLIDLICFFNIDGFLQRIPQRPQTYRPRPRPRTYT